MRSIFPHPGISKRSDIFAQHVSLFLWNPDDGVKTAEIPADIEPTDKLVSH